jgi:hypothetical protein
MQAGSAYNHSSLYDTKGVLVSRTTTGKVFTPKQGIKKPRPVMVWAVIWFIECLRLCIRCTSSGLLLW